MCVRIFVYALYTVARGPVTISRLSTGRQFFFLSPALFGFITLSCVIFTGMPCLIKYLCFTVTISISRSFLLWRARARVRGAHIRQCDDIYIYMDMDRDKRRITNNGKEPKFPCPFNIRIEEMDVISYKYTHSTNVYNCTFFMDAEYFYFFFFIFIMVACNLYL